MLKRLAVLVLALTPLAASAQPLPQIRSAGGGSGLVYGISVQGRGTVRFAAKTVQFVAQTRGNADEPAVISALRAAGVDDAVIGPIGSQVFNNAQTTLRGTIRDVSRAKLDQLARAAADYVRTHPGTSIDGVSFFVPAEACVPHEQDARAAAFGDARRRAQAIASLAGVTLDGVAAVSEYGGCPNPNEGPFPGPAQLGPPFDLGTLSASVSMNENVTFAISPGTGSMPRRPL